MIVPIGNAVSGEGITASLKAATREKQCRLGVSGAAPNHESASLACPTVVQGSSPSTKLLAVSALAMVSPVVRQLPFVIASAPAKAFTTVVLCSSCSPFFGLGIAEQLFAFSLELSRIVLDHTVRVVPRFPTLPIRGLELNRYRQRER